MAKNGLLPKEKLYITASPINGRLHNPQLMKHFVSPCELFKTGQITPKLVLKKHIKSHKKH
jgi:hypothetical protein